MRFPKGLTIAVVILVTIVAQTTIVGHIDLIIPDLAMLVAILLALTRIRPEAVLGIAFSTGLVVDLVGSSLTGLRAMVFTFVAYLAIRTRERASIGRFAIVIWAGAHTLVGVVLVVLVGTLFGQTNLLGPDVGAKLLLVPLANMIVAGLVAPFFVRLIDGDTTLLRFS